MAALVLAMATAWAGRAEAATTAEAPQLIRVSDTLGAAADGDAVHAVWRPSPPEPRPADAPAAADRARLLVWLPGTGGEPSNGPRALFQMALERGMPVVALAYPTTPAVAQVCVPRRVATMPDCAERFRQMRVFGEPGFALIDDRPADAIVPRLTQLLRHLARTDPTGQWDAFLDDTGQPRWGRLVLAGQSQGGGMAAYLAQVQSVAGVLIFSGGWDSGPQGRPAAWYARASATPAQRWHATYHREEARAAELARTYELLRIPPEQTHALALPVAGPSAHTEGIHHVGYAAVWAGMLQPR